MMSSGSAWLIAPFLFMHSARASSHGACTQHTLDFVINEGDAMHLAVEDDIQRELEALGITLNKRLLPKAEFNEAMRTGDFHLCFSETWGAPYDPVSYATGMMANDEAHYSAMAGLTGYNSRENTFSKINQALIEVDHCERAERWAEIHDMVHQSAIHIPLYGKRIPAVLNKRLAGYQPGEQQFDYPMHRVVVQEGSKTVTVAPGAQTGLFQSVGRLDPHSYRPNEFFSNNWVYEGLVSYGPDGAILPSLAESWTETADGAVFKLRTGVKFHDGEDWNCAAAKLNFDHVMAAPLRTGDYHNCTTS
jgi:nickel transport system substrate-binding protein